MLNKKIATLKNQCLKVKTIKIHLAKKILVFSILLQISILNIDLFIFCIMNILTGVNLIKGILNNRPVISFFVLFWYFILSNQET